MAAPGAGRPRRPAAPQIRVSGPPERPGTTPEPQPATGQHPGRTMVTPALRHTPAGQRLCRLAIGLLLALLAGAALASELTASVDRTRVGEGESLTLTLRYQGQALGDPDFSDLGRDFDILSTQRQSHL